MIGGTAPALTDKAEADAIPDGVNRIRSDQWHLRFLKATEAHKITQGSGVIVAVPDTGVDPHPDLERNLLPGTDISKDGDGRVDNDSHGTAMAGLIAAHGQITGVGALGIAPEAKILPIRSKQIGGKGDTEDLAISIEWASRHGADVISISAVAGASQRLQRAIRAALQADIVIVAAAGNKPFDIGVGYPASEEGVLAVGGIDMAGNIAAVSVAGSAIDITAPAVDIYSTSYEGKYSKGTGTSSATAIVAGAAALVRSKYPDLPASEVVHRLTATAVDKGPPGRDDEYGYGVVDLVAALTADVPPVGFESATAGAPGATGPTTAAVAEPAGGDDGGATARGLATLGVIVAAAGAWALVARRRRSSDDPPPRMSR
ncbi:type VII secretion-associated serine protease mycosin [Micromonospora carbonacea]|uniref:Type VII secretion-associated serine protease mycosin n=1 Tax=Micromonospora carbonacea TaxID=47853 RepID=A0A7H8XFD7_9ACTN|nr:type VII secretion-associated serine protease mycosin [Micromonospora carbonacea]QLD23657.1 type VII secretion-associated serine protease mycosin [Micromonospora carbonacea]